MTPIPFVGLMVILFGKEHSNGLTHQFLSHSNHKFTALWRQSRTGDFLLNQVSVLTW